jgi:hypothetical protein
MTVLCADRDPVDVPLKGAGKLLIDPTYKGYSRAALLQLSNECCEELGTHLKLGTLNLDLNFRETVSRR